MTSIEVNVLPARVPLIRETLEVRITRTGSELAASLNRVLSHVPGAEAGPQRLATALRVDKVLASRLLKTVRSTDAMSVMHRAPAPNRSGASFAPPASGMACRPTISALANAAVDAFDDLIRTTSGDVAGSRPFSVPGPDARRDFELRRKQAAFRAMSQLKGMQADVFAEAAIFWPSNDGQNIDVVWLKSVTGLTGLRPSISIKFTSTRGVQSHRQRRPLTLGGDPVDSVKSTVIPQFCSAPTPELIANVVGEQTHYLLEHAPLGEQRELVLCEVNRAEMARFVPIVLGRRAWASSDITLPARCQFDLLVHPEIFTNETPDLRVYDTAILGIADRNDSARDIDQFDLLENVDTLGVGINRFGSSDVPRYREILDHICQRLSYDGSILRGYRVATSYPIYGSQYAMSFRTTDAR